MSTGEPDPPADPSADPSGDPPDDDGLAAELALGVLPFADHAALERRAERDAGFAARVAAWQDRLLPLAEDFGNAAPPPSVKSGLDARLFGAAAPRRPDGWWHSLALWRGLAGAATLGLLLALALPLMTPATGPATGPATATAPDPVAAGPGPRMVASLADGSSDVHYVAVYDRTRHEVGLSHVSGLPPEGHRFALWVVGGEAAPPVPLGTIPTGAVVHMALDEAARAVVAPGARLAISLEPVGPAPAPASAPADTPSAMGTVVAMGDLRDL